MSQISISEQSFHSQATSTYQISRLTNKSLHKIAKKQQEIQLDQNIFLGLSTQQEIDKRLKEMLVQNASQGHYQMVRPQSQKMNRQNKKSKFSSFSNQKKQVQEH